MYLIKFHGLCSHCQLSKYLLEFFFFLQINYIYVSSSMCTHLHASNVMVCFWSDHEMFQTHLLYLFQKAFSPDTKQGVISQLSIFHSFKRKTHYVFPCLIWGLKLTMFFHIIDVEPDSREVLWYTHRSYMVGETVKICNQRKRLQQQHHDQPQE